MKNAHNIEPVKCLYCDRQFQTIDGAKSHQKIRHPDNKPDALYLQRKEAALKFKKQVKKKKWKKVKSYNLPEQAND